MAPDGRAVRRMFGDIAPQYDLLNRTLSLGLDRGWRRRVIRRLGLGAGDHLLDLCCGTGDLALAAARSGAVVVGADFAAPMLPLARAKAARAALHAAWLQADAQRLPLADSSFSALTMAFGIRNVEDPRQALAECHRVLRPGGRLAVLEFFDIQQRAWRALFRLYFHGLMPRLARLTRAGRTGAYRYLPESVDGFVDRQGFGDWLRGAGFEQVRDEALAGGVARLFLAIRPCGPWA